MMAMIPMEVRRFVMLCNSIVVSVEEEEEEMEM